LCLKKNGGGSNGSWEELYTHIDLDHDGIISEIDFARSIVPYHKRVLSLNNLHDVFFSSSPPPTISSGTNRAAEIFREIDRLSGSASGSIRCRDVLKWFTSSSSSSNHHHHITTEQLDGWWCDVFHNDDVSINFIQFEKYFWLPYKSKISVDYESNILQKLRKSINEYTSTSTTNINNTNSSTTNSNSNIIEAFHAFDIDKNDRISSYELKNGLKRFCNVSFKSTIIVVYFISNFQLYFYFSPQIHCSNLEISMIMDSIVGGNGKIDITKNDFIKWLTINSISSTTSTNKENKEISNKRRVRISSLMYDLIGSPRECWLSLFHSNKSVNRPTSRDVISIDQFINGLTLLFNRHDFMIVPTKEQLQR
jgi:Ca2+-binding EF-hand superfamily protein